MEQKFNHINNDFHVKNKIVEFTYLFCKLNEFFFNSKDIKQKLNILKIKNVLLTFYILVCPKIIDINVFNKKIASNDILSKHLSLLIRKYTHQLKTNKTKSRGELSFSKRKLWKQKGTGKARIGSKSSPLLRGGGVVFGPDGYIRNFKINKKLKKKLFVASFILKIQKLLLIENLDNDDIKLISKYKVLLLTNALEVNQTNKFSKFSNYKNIHLKPIKEVNVFDILKTEYILVSEQDIFVLLKRLIS